MREQTLHVSEEMEALAPESRDALLYILTFACSKLPLELCNKILIFLKLVDVSSVTCI